MRIPVFFALLCLTSCGPGLEFNNDPYMTLDQLFERSSHIFVGVVEYQQFDSWPLFRVPGDSDGYWKILRRRVRIEGVLKGKEDRKRIDVFEISWMGGAIGDWNQTGVSSRYLFPVRVENGRYHVARDWWRSIFEVKSGRHDTLPLTVAQPMPERVALMMWWANPGYSSGFGRPFYGYLGNVLSGWRTVKILRGLLRHPDPGIRLRACESLVHWGRAQDECWDQVDPADQERLNRSENGLTPEKKLKQNRIWEKRALQDWSWNVSGLGRFEGPERVPILDELRLMTTIRDEALRRRFCALYRQALPDDLDNGCPAGQPRPATIVTEKGDVPLTGAWPI